MIENIIEKIRKLLARAKGNKFPAEAASAIHLAELLMKKYNLTREQIDIEKEEIMEVDFLINNKDTNWQCHLALLIADAFYCKTIALQNKDMKLDEQLAIRFIGKKSDLLASTFIYGYLYDAITKMTEKYMSKPAMRKYDKNKAQAEKSYAYGITLAIEEKLMELWKAEVKDPNESDALIVVKNALVNKYFKDNYGKPDADVDVSEKDNNNKHLVNGYFDGKALQIRKGVENSPQEKIV